MGLPGGFPDDRGHSIVGLYLLFNQRDPDDVAWSWPQQVVPICHWGCAIYSCVDCSSAQAPVLIWDPNVHESGSNPRTAIRPHGRDLEQWLYSWAQGVDLWAEMFPE